MKSILNLFNEASQAKLDPRLKAYARNNGIKVGEGADETSREELIKQLAVAEESLYAQFSGKDFNGEYLDPAQINMTEALNSSDASIIFPRVISEVLQEPTEPNLFLTGIADTIRLADKAPLSIEFPTVDALQAFEMSEGQDYTVQTMSFAQHMTSIRIKKMGVAAAVNEEVITQSMWPIIQLHLKMMANAINRKVESTLYQAMTQRAQIVFDNENTNAEYHTTGKYLTGTGSALKNGSFSYNDLVKMCGVMLGNRYEPTHFLAHPLAWPIFAQDPIMRAQFYHGGQMGAGMWTRMPAFDQSANFPFGISYVPYYMLPYNETDTLTGVMSGLGASLTSDLYIIDSKNALFMATRGNTEMDQMENWFRDATMLKARKYVGISAKSQGKGMLKAANVRIVANEEPIATFRTLAA